MKATSIFGGVQVINIVIALIRSKFVALLLGPAGMGVMGLLQSTLSLVGAATNFGLGSSAVRDISEANGTGNQQKINLTVSIFRKLIWLTGLLGMVLTIALSPLLSKLTFGNYDYTFAFMALAVTLLINQLASGQLVLLQGLRKIKWLAKATVYGSVCGLLVSIPLFYFFGIHGIVPSIIITALALFAVQYWFAHKVKFEAVVLSFREAVQQGKPMLKLGFVLSLSGLITVAASYIIRIFISNTGGVEDVGFYNAGFTMIGTYVGMIFTAMGTDYFPRLSAVSHSNSESAKMINEQSEIAILIISPILIIFLVFIKWIIIILYSEQFQPVTTMLLWMALGMLFKAGSWAIGFVMPAKGDGKTFFYSELTANLYILVLNIVGYYYFGLEGLGISFLIGYVLYYLQVYVIAHYKYDFRFSTNFYNIMVLQMIMGIAAFLVSRNSEGLTLYLTGSGIAIIALSFSIFLLNKKLNLLQLLKRK